MEALLQKIALIGSIVLPFWNIPLILHIVKRKSSRDVSLPWAWGVWGCLALMFPSGILSHDPVWKIFNVTNFVLFSVVLMTILFYRKERGGSDSAGRRDL